MKPLKWIIGKVFSDLTPPSKLATPYYCVKPRLTSGGDGEEGEGGRKFVVLIVGIMIIVIIIIEDKTVRHIKTNE